jgi:hypothetical protein
VGVITALLVNKELCPAGLNILPTV